MKIKNIIRSIKRMKKITKFYIIFFIVIVFAIGYAGCSKVEDNLVTSPEIGIHPSGWITPGNANFHGKYIRDNNLWHLTLCKSCHGNDYNGGNTGASCRTCHTTTEGPQDCGTCHGSSDDQPWPPLSLNRDSLETDRGVGVHNHHLSPDSTERYSAQVRCVSCHQQFDEFDSPLHHQNPYGIATIHFDSLALNVLGDTTVPHPTYDRVTNKCSNVYCHGNFKNGNRDFQPVFNDPKSVVCGSCHGDALTGNPNPKPNGIYVPPHSSFYTITTCYKCHSSVINPQGQIIAPSKHINGVVNFDP